MIKLTSMIVDGSYRLVGFIGEGRAKDFGELSTEKVTRPISLKYMFDTKFSNKQMAIKGGSIIEKEGFKLSNLSMVMLENNGYTPVDNSITLTKRYVKDNENIGFGVVLAGRPAKFTYENVIKLCDMFKPTNFVIRNGAEGKRFIAGKTGASLTSLPVENIGEASTAKRTKSTTKEADKITGGFVTEVDILDLYDFIRDVNGFIVNLPSTHYKANTASAAAGEDFVPFNIGEIGTPYPVFNETKFNVSCNFKKPGAVIMTLDGKKQNVITFTYAQKNVFYNGDNYINKLGVIIPAGAVDKLINKFGASMSFTEITDPGVITPICMLIAQQNVKMYEVDTSKIGIIAKGKLDSLVIDTKTVYEKTIRLMQNKLIAKYMNGLLKELKESGITVGSKPKAIAPQFSGMSDEALNTLMENGIDIISGAYTVKDYSKKTSGSSTDDVVEVQYAIDGLNVERTSYKMIAEGGDKIPNFLNAIVAKMNSITDMEARAIKANEIAEQIEKENNQIKRELWLHKTAMYLKSNKSSVHAHDKKNWELNTKKRTAAKCYNCKVAGCEKLQILVKNIDIK